MGRKYAAGFPQAKGVKSLFSNIIFFCFNSNILYTPLSHHKLWNVGIETLEKHTILEKQALPYPQGRLHYRLVVRLVLPAGSILRLNTELVPVTTKGLPEKKGEEVRSWKALIHLMTWWGRSGINQWAQSPLTTGAGGCGPDTIQKPFCYHCVMW